MTDVFIIIFIIAFALSVMISFVLLLLRREIAGRPRFKADEYDFGFARAQPDSKTHS